MLKKPTKKSEEAEIARLRRQDAKKDEFFLAASHQLKSPLAIIQWCLQSALESKEVKGKDREMIRKSVAQAEAMSHLVTDMLHIVRLAGRGRSGSVTSVALNIATLTQEAMHNCEVFAHKHQVSLVAGPMELVGPVFAEEAYLRQALINLIDNAIKYSPKGAVVTVTIKEVSGGYVEVSVKDQGIGIPEAEQSRLFTEFFRGAQAQAVTHEGTGLGLVLVKHVVEEFGGSIHFISALHKGSTFTVRLPVSSDRHHHLK